MPDAPPTGGPSRAARPLDPVAAARVQRRLHTAAAAPWLHGEVARRMAVRLALIRMQPQCLIDWGAFVGGSREALSTAYPRARCIAVDAWPTPASAASLRRWWPFAGPPRPAWSVVAPDAVADESAALLWSNMHLHGQSDPMRLFTRWRQALQTEGFLMFSTVGPGTLRELSQLYAAAGWGLPCSAFVDMHDLGDMLVEAGFADPVMDQETLALTWESPHSLLAELRTLGGNTDPNRHAGLRTPRWRERLCAALAARGGADGRVRLEFEIVYGHAFKPLPRPRVSAQTAVPLGDMRSMVRARRGTA